MGNVVRTLSVVICAFIALEGCRPHNNNRKPSILRSQKGGTEVGKSEWGGEVKGNATCGCLRLEVLSNLLQNLDKELLSIHVADADFVTVKTEPVTARPSAPKPTEEKPKQLSCIANRARVSFQRLEGDLDPVKLNYFFRDSATHIEQLAETFPSKEIGQTARFADLIGAKDQKGCESVNIFTGQGGRVFEVVEGTPSSIKLRSGDEIRSYTLMPNDQVLITVVTRVANVDRCGNTSLPATFHRLQSYIISKAANKDRFPVHTNLAQLYRYIYDTAELRGVKAKPMTPQSPAAKEAPKPAVGAGKIINLSGATLQFLAFKYANRKDGDFTCSTPVLPRN